MNIYTDKNINLIVFIVRFTHLKVNIHKYSIKFTYKQI